MQHYRVEPAGAEHRFEGSGQPARRGMRTDPTPTNPKRARTESTPLIGRDRITCRDRGRPESR